MQARVVAGSASVLVKVRTSTTTRLQDVLRRLYDIQGVSGTRATVVLETFFERPVSPMGQMTAAAWHATGRCPWAHVTRLGQWE
ncbi:Lrp/AsnC ligand binding domain-containing protein [Spirillospora sp. CA-128828]|uniref:Lrp/AsnC ligand binding domain-containing protein n=1 Tax=Spirillospora sp. CA-128828 TaxID=3240033 RepID=UPI003D8E0A2E